MQLLRGVAASMVVAYHLIERYQRRGVFPLDGPGWIDRLGEVGVLVFFAISGFIMVYTTVGTAKRVTTARGFLRNRVSRIAPLYYLTTLLIVAFRLATEGMSTKPFVLPSAGEWVTSFLFIPYRNGEGDLQPIYKLGWTLNYEMAFYLLFALGLALGRRRVAWIVIASLGAIVASGSLLPRPHANGLALIAFFLSRPILLYFALGMALALVFGRIRRFRPIIHPLPVVGAACGAIALAVVDDPAMSLLWVAIALGVATLLDARMIATPRFSRFADAFGDASYSIYLTHSFLLGAYAAATARLAPAGAFSWVALIGGGCLICFVGGWVTWRWVEMPMTRWLRTRRS